MEVEADERPVPKRGQTDSSAPQISTAMGTRFSRSVATRELRLRPLPRHPSHLTNVTHGTGSGVTPRRTSGADH